MPRKGLLGPLIILLLGVLFLLKNFRPDIPVWDLFGKYWPLLLILWGLAKLIEAARPPQPGVPSRPLITGGEVFLVVFLCLIGTGVYQFGTWRPGIRWRIPPIFQETFHYNADAKLKVTEKQPKITVYNPRGDVRITGGDGAEITVKAEKQVQAMNETEAKKLDELVKLEVVKEGDGYVVRSNADRADGQGSVSTAMEIQLPKGATLDVQARRGDVQIAQVLGAVTLNVERGDVRLQDLGDKVRVDLRRGSFSAERIKGNIEMDGRGNDLQVNDVEGEVVIRGEYSGNINFANVKKVVHVTTSRTELEIQRLPGKVDMTMGSLTITQPSGPVSVSTRAKDIRIEDFDGPIQIVNRDASVELTTNKTPLPSIGVENKSGRIEVTLPASASFQVEGTARRGEVTSDFSEISASQENEQGTLRGGVGKNGPTVKLNTTYGSISIRKG